MEAPFVPDVKKTKWISRRNEKLEQVSSTERVYVRPMSAGAVGSSARVQTV